MVSRLNPEIVDELDRLIAAITDNADTRRAIVDLQTQGTPAYNLSVRYQAMKMLYASTGLEVDRQALADAYNALKQWIRSTVSSSYASRLEAALDMEPVPTAMGSGPARSDPPIDLSSYTDAQLQNLTVQEAPRVTSRQLEALDDHVRFLSRDVLCSLSPDQMTGVKLSALSTTQLQDFSAWQLTQLKASQITELLGTVPGEAAVRSEKLRSLLGSDIWSLNPEAVSALKLEVLSLEQLRDMTPRQLTRVVSSQITGLIGGANVTATPEMINKLQTLLGDDIASLTPSAVTALKLEHLTDLQLGGFTNDQVANFQSGQLDGLSGARWSKLGIKFASVPSGLMLGLPATKVRLLDATQVTALGSRVAEFSVDALKDLLKDDAKVAALTPAGVAALIATRREVLFSNPVTTDNTKTILHAVPAATIAQLAPTDIANLGLTSLTVNQCRGLKSNQLGLLPAPPVATVTPDPIAERLTAMGDEVAGLSVTFISGMNTAQAGALTTRQLTALGANAAEIRTEFLESILSNANSGATALAALTPAALDGIIAKKYSLLYATGTPATNRLTSLSDTQIQGLSLESVRSLGNQITHVFRTLPRNGTAIETIFEPHQIPGIKLSALTAVQLPAFSLSEAALFSPGQVVDIASRINELNNDFAVLSKDAVIALVERNHSAVTAAQVIAYGEATKPDGQGKFLDLPQSTFETLYKKTTLVTSSNVPVVSWNKLPPYALGRSDLVPDSAISSMTLANFNSLSADRRLALQPRFHLLQSTILTSLQPSEVGAMKLSALDATRLAAFTSAQLGGFTRSQLAEFQPPANNNTETTRSDASSKLGSLLSGRIELLNLDAVSGIPMDLLSQDLYSGMTSAQWAAFTSNQIQSSSGQFLPRIGSNITKLNDATLQAISAVQAQNITSDQFKALAEKNKLAKLQRPAVEHLASRLTSEFGKLSLDAVPPNMMADSRWVSDDRIVAMTGPEASAMNSEHFFQMASRISLMPPALIGRLTSIQLARVQLSNMTVTQIGFIRSATIRDLPPTVGIANLTPQKVQAFQQRIEYLPSALLQSIPVSSFSRDQLKVVLGKLAGTISPVVMQAIPADLMPAFGRFVRDLRPETVAAVTPAQAGKFSANQVREFNEKFVSLSVGAIGVIWRDPSKVKAITPEGARSLSLAKLSGAPLEAFSIPALREIGAIPGFSATVTDSQRARLSRSQRFALGLT